MKSPRYIVVTMANRKNYYVARLLPGDTYTVVAYASQEDVAKRIAKTFNEDIKP